MLHADQSQPGQSASFNSDVIVVGAGFAGCAAAVSLTRAGLSVTLIDTQTARTPILRAEKISAQQLALLDEPGLIDAFKARSSVVRKAVNVRGRRIVDTVPIEEYGIRYPDMISVMRDAIGQTLAVRQAQVVDIETSEDMQRVCLHGGETLSARLVVLATGLGEALGRHLKFEREIVDSRPTICAGFTLKPPPEGFAFPSLCAYGERRGDKIDYLTLFPIEGGMRGNLFLFSDIRDPRLAALRDRGLPALLEILPGLRQWLNGTDWGADVAIFPIMLSRLVNPAHDGIVVVGDAFRVSCPSVGSGLTCALRDARELGRHAAVWMATPGMAAAKLASFYDDPKKRACDDDVFANAICRREAVTTTSWVRHLRHDLHFAKRHILWRLEGLSSAATRKLGFRDPDHSVAQNRRDKPIAIDATR